MHGTIPFPPMPSGEAQQRRGSAGPPGLLLAESHALIAGPFNLLDGLTAKERELVLSCGQRRVLDRGDLLFVQGAPHEGIYLVESGRIRVFYSAPSGREITLAYWYPGNFVGGPEIFGGGTHMWSAVAARNSAVVMLPGKSLKALIPKVPTLAIGLIDGLVFKGKCYSTLAQMLGTRSVTERLIQMLLHLADLYGVEDAEGVLIGATFTHEDLAHMVGATRQWVTVSLKRLQAAGLLQNFKGRIIIHDLAKLAAMREAAE